MKVRLTITNDLDEDEWGFSELIEDIEKDENRKLSPEEIKEEILPLIQDSVFSTIDGVEWEVEIDNDN